MSITRTTDNFREPEFNSEHNLIVAATNETGVVDSTEGLTLKAAILIFSYNRPKMLTEAIESVINQDYEKFDIYVVDDGSDIFDPWHDVIRNFDDERILLARASKIPVEERMKQSRLGRNANSVIKTLPDQDIVYYLCDDDLMAQKWLSRSIRTFQMMPEVHVVQGEAWYFQDGEDPLKDAIYGMPADGYSDMPTMFWSTGSFAHKALCSNREGLWWMDNSYLHSQDTNFINDLWSLHPNYGMVSTPAVYRREHSKTLSAKLGRKNELGRYQSGYIPPPATKEMLEDLE